MYAFKLPRAETNPALEFQYTFQSFLDCCSVKKDFYVVSPQSPERLNLLGWQKRVETATEKLGATFLDFNLHTGYWVFTVRFFSEVHSC